MSAPPSNPLLTLSAISLFTEDLPASIAFYTNVFSASILNEDAVSCAVKFNNTIINLLSSSAAPELISPAPVAPQSAGNRFQLTVWVDDLEAAMETLRAKGVVFVTGPETKAWGLRTVTFVDPAGHSWEVGQDVSKK